MAVAVKNKGEKIERKRKNLNVFTLLFWVLVGAALLTHLIPSGKFERVMDGGRTVINTDTFVFTGLPGAGFLDIFRAIPNGLVSAAPIVIGTLIIGGAIEVFYKTDAINIGIAKGIMKFGTKSGPALIIVATFLFSAMGGFLGFAEASIPFIPLAVALSIGLGYDTVVGVAIGFLGGFAGFIAGPTNPLLVGIPHEYGGMPMFSGLGLRVILFIIFTALTCHHIISYAQKIKKDPTKSLMYGVDISDIDVNIEKFSKVEMTYKHILILLSLILPLLGFIIGALKFGWGFNELGAMFILGMLSGGIIGGLSADEITGSFVNGAQKIAGGALIIGFANSIGWVLEEAQIIDTLVHYMSGPLTGLPAGIASLVMMASQTVISVFIPSGSGQAMATMPIMFPLAEAIGMTKQNAILAFQLGRGIIGTICPTIGGIFLSIAFGRISYDKWLKFALPYSVKLTVVSVIVLFVGVAINYGPM